MDSSNSFSFRRLCALCLKEGLQIRRDPANILICLIIPMLLLGIFGYGISFDSASLRVGIVLEDPGPEARKLAESFLGSKYFEARISPDRQELVRLMQAGKLRGMVIIPADFSRRLESGPLNENIAPIQIITDGSEPNTANFVQAYIGGAWLTWQEQRLRDLGLPSPPAIRLEERYWFNQDAVSRNFIIPGAITIILTVVGAVLTSLVIVREWERGSMEALLSTRITRAELLLSKFIPYYLLGLIALAVCVFCSITLFGVPFRGSFPLLWIISSLSLANTLGLGLLISTLSRNQFNAAQATLNAAFMPAVMLSGFVFEIDSMPALIRGISYLIPARYYVRTMHTLFLAGNILPILLLNALFLLATACLFLGLTTINTKLRLE